MIYRLTDKKQFVVLFEENYKMSEVKAGFCECALKISV